MNNYDNSWINVSSISQTVEVPCKNELLKKEESKLLTQPRENFYVRVDKPWSFYYPKEPKWPMFQDCFFQEDKNYDWVFMTDSPLKLFFEITRKCNLTCKWCYIPDMKWDEINFDNIKSIVDDASASKVLSIQLLWWEPTLHQDFIEVCKYIKSKWITVESVSNWMKLIDKKYVNSLKWVIDYFAISIDWNEETHNDIRRNKNSYKNAITWFNNLVEAWINTEVLMTVNKKNIWDIDELFKALWSDNTKFYLKIMHIADKMPEFLKEICLSKNEIVELKKKADDMWIWIQAPVAEFKQEKESSFFWCPWGILTWIIDTSWYVYKCLYLRDKSEQLWNVFEKKLSEIWADTKKSIEELQWDKCSTCSMKSVCGWFCTLCKTNNRYI